VKPLASLAVIIAFGTVTAEAAGPSPAVPAILFKHLRVDLIGHCRSHGTMCQFLCQFPPDLPIALRIKR
jgi:hypothetical protein